MSDASTKCEGSVVGKVLLTAGSTVGLAALWWGTTRVLDAWAARRKPPEQITVVIDGSVHTLEIEEPAR